MSPTAPRPRRFLVGALTSILGIAAAWAADNPAPYYFTTLAGQASRGSVDGTGNAARFCEPAGAAVDVAGNVYVADAYNHTIRRISAGGVVTTLAGSAGNAGSADGTGATARFNLPTGVALDGLGNILVADSANHLIRKITPGGTVTTLAGSAGVSGSSDGPGAAARFNLPTGVAVNSAGEVFVADSGNHLIRRITTSGGVTTLAGTAGSSGADDGTGSAARFWNPTGVTVDAAGNVFVADNANATIRKITPAGVVSTLAGLAGSIGATDGAGAGARFFFPRAVAADAAGNILVADIFNCAVRRVTPAGVVTTLAGQPGSEIGWADGTGSAARFGYLVGMAVDAAGNAYAVDMWHNSVRKITPAGVVTTLAGNGDSMGSGDGAGAAARFYRPSGVAVDGPGNVYVADQFNSTIRKITPTGTVSTLAGLAGSAGSADGPAGTARFNYPLGLAVDAAGNVFVSEPSRNVIRKITPAGVVTTFAGTAGVSGFADGTGAAAQFDYPCGLAVDGADNVYVGDRNNEMIRKITPAGVVTTLAGSPWAIGAADGTGRAAQFAGPEGVAVDPAGNVYVADFYNCTIRRITPAGVVTTLAGRAGVSGTVDGTGGEARFDHPSNLAVDTDGNVYVVDTLNHTFRRITPAGVVTTLAGSIGNVGSANNGVGSSVRFFSPTGVALNRTGFAYVADTQNNTIRQGQLASAPVTTTQPLSQTVAAGASVQFSVAVAAVPAPTYQWQFNGSPFNGATSATLSFTSARSTDAGDYTVVVTNALGSVTSAKAILTVTAAPVTPLPPVSSGSGGGGGGAPSIWFVFALALLTGTRRLVTRR